MKKYLSELSNEELEKLIANNSTLYEMLYDHAYSVQCDWISDEVMYDFPYNYSVSAWRSDYVDLPINDSKAHYAVSKWLYALQRKCEFFSEREENIIMNYVHNAEAFYEYPHDEDEEVLVFNSLAVAQYEAQQTILSKLQNELWSASDMSVLLEEFDLWLMNLDRDYYTNEELTHIFVDVPRKVIEAHTEQIM